MLFPLPIPEAKPRDDNGDLHYMSLEETLSMPFTDEHQPSKISRTAVASTKRNRVQLILRLPVLAWAEEEGEEEAEAEVERLALSAHL
jgi:hypothetical protein